MSKRTNDLGRDPIGPLLLRLAIPSVTAQLVNALYNIVDRIYIGHIPGEGQLALTGLGVTFPVLMIISALSSVSCSHTGIYCSSSSNKVVISRTRRSHPRSDR